MTSLFSPMHTRREMPAMSRYDWLPLLSQWSHEIIRSRTFEQFLLHHGSEYQGLYPEELLDAGWLGYPGATEDQITAAEARLGTPLPPDYRAFLQTTNGWRWIGPFIPRIWAVEELDYVRSTDPDLVQAWTDPELGELYEGRYIASAVQISDREVAGTAVYLLNPAVLTPQGEWEAWFMAHWVPGANRYPSFWSMLHAEHEAFLRLEAYQS